MAQYENVNSILLTNTVSGLFAKTNELVTKTNQLGIDIGNTTNLTVTSTSGKLVDAINEIHADIGDVSTLVPVHGDSPVSLTEAMNMLALYVPEPFATGTSTVELTSGLPIDMAGEKITNLGTPSVATDAVRLSDLTWTNVTGKPASIDATPHTVGSHTDISLTNLSNGEALVWISAASRFENRVPNTPGASTTNPRTYIYKSGMNSATKYDLFRVTTPVSASGAYSLKFMFLVYKGDPAGADLYTDTRSYMGAHDDAGNLIISPVTNYVSDHTLHATGGSVNLVTYTYSVAAVTNTATWSITPTYTGNKDHMSVLGWVEIISGGYASITTTAL